MKTAFVLSILSLFVLGAVVSDELFGAQDDSFFDSDENVEEPDLLNGDDENLEVKQFEIDTKAALCPKTFTYDAKLQFCFMVVDHQKGSIYLGRNICSKLVDGGRLAELDTKEKVDLVTQHISRVSGPGYLLGALRTKRSPYKWISGQQVTFGNWCPGSPDRNQQCIRLVRTGNRLCMDDDCCFHPKNFICEKPIM